MIVSNQRYEVVTSDDNKMIVYVLSNEEAQVENGCLFIQAEGNHQIFFAPREWKSCVFEYDLMETEEFNKIGNSHKNWTEVKSSYGRE